MSDEHDSWLQNAFGLDVDSALQRIKEEGSAAFSEATSAVSQVVQGVQNAVAGAIDAASYAVSGVVSGLAGTVGGITDQGGGGGSAPKTEGAEAATGSFPLRGSVGRGGQNAPGDVRAVQAALGITVDGQCGPRTIEAIEAHQVKAMGLTRPDGRVDPGGATERSLAGGGGTAKGEEGGAKGLLDEAGEALSGAVNSVEDAVTNLVDQAAWLLNPEFAPFGRLAETLKGAAVEQRRPALDAALALHAGGGDSDLRASLGLPLAEIALPSATCSVSPCPDPAEEEPAVYPVWKQAELCIQSKYKESHGGNTIGVNKEWLTLVGRDPAERQALECLRRNFTAKSGMSPGEPDLWDFSNRTMYEITTRSGAAFRKGKLQAEIALANSLTGTAECGGTLYSPGDWAPPGPCLYIGEGLWAHVVNEGGVLVYTALRQGRKKEPVPDPGLLPLIILLLEALRRLAPAAKPAPTPRPVSPILIPTKLLKCLLAPDIDACMSGDDTA